MADLLYQSSKNCVCVFQCTCMGLVGVRPQLVINTNDVLRQRDMRTVMGVEYIAWYMLTSIILHRRNNIITFHTSPK